MINSIFFLSLYFCLTMFRSRTTNVKSLPLWTWECVNEKCLPVQVKDFYSKLQSLPTCNMLCSSIQLWPQPTGHVSLSTTAVPIKADLVQLQKVSDPIDIVKDHINEAFLLMRDDLKVLEKKGRRSEEWRNSVVVRVFLNGSADPRMRMTTDESYKLTLQPTSDSGKSLIADVIAKSFCGVRHAFETLSQLIWLDPYQGTLLILEQANIEDSPKFGYRGLLLDTASTYFTVTEISRLIDGMSACKLNTLHWRVSNSQAFSLQLNSVPELYQHGAYSQPTIYSSLDIQAIVRQARLRGIRVIIELDTPSHVGHAWGWGESHGIGPLAHCIDSKPWTAYCSEPPCGQLNPRNKYLFELLERIYAEIIQLTGVDDIFHLGGDDISELCWAENFNDTSPIELWADYTRMALHHLELAHGKLPNLTLLWSSQFSELLKTHLKDYIHELGLQSRNVAWEHKHVVGLRTVISHEDAWDLNSGLGSWYEETGAPYNSWQRIYEYRPWSRNPEWRVEGGEATIWTSSLTGSGLDARVWPRAAALAERLWTDRAEGATRPIHVRLDVFRSRLVERGIKAAPIWSMWCTHHTYTCV